MQNSGLLTGTRCSVSYFLVVAVLAAVVLAGILRALGRRVLGVGRILAGRIAVVLALVACIACVVCVVRHNDFLLNLNKFYTLIMAETVQNIFPYFSNFNGYAAP